MERRLAIERAGALEASDIAERFVVTRAPTLPYDAAFPNRPLIIFIGVFLGITVGLGMGILAEVIDDSIRNTRDVRTIVGAPPIAAIPVIRTETESRAVVRSRRLTMIGVSLLLVLVATYVQLQISGAI
jgi:hypothetical protein